MNNDEFQPIYPGDDIVGTGNIIGDVENTGDNKIVNPAENDPFYDDFTQGPIIVNDQNDQIQEEVNNEVNNEINNEIENAINEKGKKDDINIEMREESNVENENTEDIPKKTKKKNFSTVNFKELEEEIEKLQNEKTEIDKQIEDLNIRKEEIDKILNEKEEQIAYKKEVENTTDKLKTYIKDLEVDPGAVRDALAALMDNMD